MTRVRNKLQSDTTAYLCDGCGRVALPHRSRTDSEADPLPPGWREYENGETRCQVCAITRTAKLIRAGVLPVPGSGEST